jgi:hypothetical protein
VAQFGYTTAAPAAAINLMIASAGREALSFLALAGVMLVQDPLMSLIGVLLGPLAFLTARKLRGRLQRIAVRGFDGQARLQEIVLDTLHGMRLSTMTPEHLARASVEGMLCGLADGLDALREQGVRVERLLLIGGGAQSEAVRRIAPQVFGLAARESRRDHRNPQQLLLEQRDAERPFQHRLERRMRIDDRLAAGAPIQIRMHHLPDDRPRADDRNLHDKVVETRRLQPRQRRHLRARFDLE